MLLWFQPAVIGSTYRRPQWPHILAHRALSTLIPAFRFILYSETSFLASAPLFSATSPVPQWLPITLGSILCSPSPPNTVCVSRAMWMWMCDLQLYNLSHNVLFSPNAQLCRALPISSDVVHSPTTTPTIHSSHHPHTTPLCTATLQLRSCCDGCSVEPQSTP